MAPFLLCQVYSIICSPRRIEFDLLFFRFPSTSSYVDPLSVFKDLSCCGISISEAEEAPTISNGKQLLKK